MPEALARSRNDSVLSRPVRGSSRPGGRGLAQAVLRRLLSQPARTMAGAALTAVMTGIIVNALVMQKEHRALPLFGASRAASDLSRPAAAGGEAASVKAQPSARSVGLAAAADPPLPPARTDDPIRDFLRGDSGKDSGRLVMAAQSALIRLGYPIKADGVIGASTEQAIQRFERAHGMAASKEVTPRLVRLLSGATR